jgi:hypothetical protein
VRQREERVVGESNRVLLDYVDLRLRVRQGEATVVEGNNTVNSAVGRVKKQFLCMCDCATLLLVYFIFSFLDPSILN